MTCVVSDNKITCYRGQDYVSTSFYTTEVQDKVGNTFYCELTQEELNSMKPLDPVRVVLKKDNDGKVASVHTEKLYQRKYLTYLKDVEHGN